MAAVAKKQKCKYWNKCYRKDKSHKQNFLHPEEDGDTDTEIEDVEPKKTPSKLKRNKTHEISIVPNEEDDMEVEEIKPTLKKLRSRSVSMTDNPKSESPDKEVDPNDDRPDCKYWDKCYRKEAGHFKQFRHPSDGQPRKSSRPKPDNKLEDGEEKSITGGYRLKRIGSHFTCTCIGWKVQKNAPNKRTCKHLREYLGDNYEKARVGKLPVEKRAAPEPSKTYSHISVSLLLAHKYDEKKTVMSSGLSMKFVSQEEVDEKRKKRQEEWEKIRKPDDPLECPEEEVDNRSLYERLQEQKNKKEKEYEDQFALKNSVKGLEEDEVAFLDHVSQRQIEINKARNSEEARIIQELKDSAVHRIEDGKEKEEKKKPQMGTSQNKKSQQSLLAGVVKRKSAESNDDSKKRKLSEEEPGQSDEVTTNAYRTQTAQIIGVLPGLGAYDNDTSDSETSSSDSETDFKLANQKKIHVHIENE